jgi:two-component system LytT family response regulator
MMNCIIVEDQATSRKTLRNFLGMLCPQVEIVAEADTLAGAKEIIAEKNPDLVFLDIEMEGQTTFNLLSEIEIIDFLIIFVTGHSDYSLQAIKKNAIDYLLKPVNPDELIEAVNKAEKQFELKKINQQQEEQKQYNRPVRVALASANETCFTEIDDIVYCKADNTYTTFSIINTQKKFVVSKPLRYYDELFASHGFFRCHKSFLINLSHVSRFSQAEGLIIEMKNGESVQLARSRKEEFFNKMNSL